MSQNPAEDSSIQPRSLPVTGTVSFSRMLNLNVGSEISVSGPLASPAAAPRATQ
jgi:hypothetical protein